MMDILVSPRTMSGTVLPIPKGKNLNYSDSANYRDIALGSIIGKIYDLYVGQLTLMNGFPLAMNVGLF